MGARQLSVDNLVIRVLVADSTRIHSQLLADAIRKPREVDVVASVASSQELLAAVGQMPDGVVLVSPSLDQDPFRGFEIVRELRISRPEIRAIMLLDSCERESVVEAFRAGARGVFSKNDSQKHLAKCIRCVYHGQIWATAQELAFAIDALASTPHVRAVNSKGLNLLSRREMDVVQCLSEGLTNREIGKQLGLSRHTVKNYLLRIFDKLGASNRMELLFLTLSQPPAASDDNEDIADPREKDASESNFEIGLALQSEQSAEPPRDPVSAYMWCLVAEHKNQAVAERIAAFKVGLEDSLSPQHLAEASRRASQFLSSETSTSPRVGAMESVSPPKKLTHASSR